MSRQAIAAVLAREDLAGGERLVAFSLASFAGHDGRAWPGAPAAAARAGLSRSRYLYDRDQLVRRGLIVVEEIASGRGRSSTVALLFAGEGPWWDGEVNAELFETVLSRTRMRGPARLLHGAMAALADPDGVVRGVSSRELSAAAGVADRSYRRARRELLQSGELALLSGAVGRGNTNVWQVRRSAETLAPRATARSPRRVVPPAGARPLLAPVVSPAGGQQVDPVELGLGVPADGKCPDPTGISAGKGGQDRTVTGQNCPVWSGVSTGKGGQDGTLFELPAPENPAQNPAETPAENPAANTRAGVEPQNPRTENPPNPPGPGGSGADSMLVEQIYVTERGRRRQRMVRVDLDAIRRGLEIPTAADRREWQQVRELLKQTVGETMFAIWLEPAELIAVDGDRSLIVAVPPATASWTRDRFGRLMAKCADQVGRELRFASDPEVYALGGAERRVQQPRQEAAG